MAGLAQRFPIYHRLLSLYPRAYYKTYGEQQLQTLADMLDNASSASQRLGIWLRLYIDFPLSVVIQQLSYGGTMVHDTPPYIKRNGLIAAILLLPFTLALIANAATTLLLHHTLYSSWLWQMPLLGFWVLWSPSIATVLALATLCVFLVKRQQYPLTTWRVIVRQSWTLIIVAGVGLFIVATVFGHDSVHCVVGNPVRELQQWHQTWRCIEQR